MEHTTPLVDIDSISIKSEMPKEERIKQFLSDAKSPDQFSCGGVPVRIRFVNSEKTLSASLEQYFTSLK